MKKITIFTTTYNRAYCLHQVYESLLRQTSVDFEWLIVDDGSTDTTKILVHSWIEEKVIDIRYIYQDNQGMHGGYNTAYANIDSQLNMCIDSDDYLTDDAVEKVLNFWKLNGDKNYAGIVALDALKEGGVLGKRMPDQLKSSTLEDLYYEHHINGDKKLVYRTEIVKSFPKYPIYKEESFVPLGSLYLQIDKEYELLCMNEVLCIVEYLDDGSTRNIFKQYVRHPRGFRYSRTIEIAYSKYFKVRCKALIHYVSSSIFLKEYNFFKDKNPVLLTLLAIPIGVIFSLYIKFKTKK